MDDSSSSITKDTILVFKRPDNVRTIQMDNYGYNAKGIFSSSHAKIQKAVSPISIGDSSVETKIGTESGFSDYRKEDSLSVLGTSADFIPLQSSLKVRHNGSRVSKMDEWKKNMHLGMPKSLYSNTLHQKQRPGDLDTRSGTSRK